MILDERSQGPDQRRCRNEVGERGINLAPHAKNEMSHLMRSQNAQQAGGEGNAQQQAMPVLQRPLPGPVIRVGENAGKLWLKLN